MNRILTLLRLQAIDQEWDEKSKRVREIDERLASDPVTAAARTASKSELKTLTELRRELTSYELEGKTADSRLKELEERLYGGRVTIPKELDELEKQLGMLKRQRSDLDDRLLELMDAVERAQVSAGDSAKRLTVAEGHRDQEIKELSQTRAELTVRLGLLEPERVNVRASSDVDALRAYDHLRQKLGRAVAPIHRDACSICGVAVPTGLIQRVRQGDVLVFCSGCGRILAS